MKKHAVIYGLNVAGMKAAINLGMGGYEVLFLNRGDYVANNPTQLLSYDPTNITNGYLMKGIQAVPTVDIWHGAEIEDINPSENGISLKIKIVPPDVEPSKCVECGLCVQKGMEYEPRPIGGVYRFPAEISDEKKKKIHDACPFGAVNIEKNAKYRDVDADVFVIASEYEFDKQKLKSLGVGKIKNLWPITKVHRLFFGVGTHSQFLKDEEGNKIKSLALLNVDSLNSGSYFNYVSFLSLIKFALKVKSVAPEVKIDIYYNLPNFYGKALLNHIRDAQKQGVNIIKYKPEDLTINDGPAVMNKKYDIVSVSYPEVAPNSNKYIAEKLGLGLKDGYIETQPGTLETKVKRVFAAGAAHESKSNSDAIRDGDVVALESFAYLSEPLRMPEMPQLPNYDDTTPVYGTLLCKCALEYQTHGKADKVIDYAREIFGNNVEVSDFLCLDAKKKAESLIKKGVNRISVGACTMSLRGGLLLNMIQKAGLDSSYADIVQLKEWGNSEDVQKSMLKRSKAVLSNRKQSTIPVDDKIEKKAIIIGDSVSALTAALSIARAGLNATILLKDKLSPVIPEQSLLVNKLNNINNVKILEKARIESIDGYGGHFIVNVLLPNNEKVEERAGVILFAPANYEIPDTTSFKNFNHIGIIFGDNKKGTSSARLFSDVALRLIESLIKDGKKVSLGAAITAFRGKNVKTWSELLKNGHLNLVVAPEPLADSVFDSMESALKKEGAEVVVALRSEETSNYNDIVKMLDLRMNDDGTIYYIEDPYDDGNIKMVSGPMLTKGIFISGPFRKPMSFEEEMLDGQSEAMKMLAVIAQPAIMAPGMRMISYTNYRKCAGCALCVEACHYGARFIDPEDNIAKVHEALCEGCAACVSACPSGAAEVRMLEAKQMLQSISTLLLHEK